ncbi:uncharacterized protein LOC127167787 [Labeo rohita]|uniref:uncharacterized protein LOC127167787 n=1 Tax=Labeo rohita TaxID=84645 RepID=UPI0021E32708|nr:uncharacterized protein LOC127167787 [Labeo rohita]
MLHISAAASLLFGTGFLQVVFSITNMQAHPGQSVSMWCPHNIHVSGNLYWFKQTDSAVPITILRISFTESQKVDKKYLNDFTRDNLVTHHFNKSTNLTIKNVSISDSGFYFCGTAGDQMEFGHGTRLEVKVNGTMVNDSYWSTVLKHLEKNVTSEKNGTKTSEKDHEKSPMSTEECSRNVYFILTLLFGGIIFCTYVIPFILAIIKKRRQKHKKVIECQAQQQDNKENDSVEYAAVYFSNKRPKKAGRH